MTQQQDVVRAKGELVQLKADYMTALQAYMDLGSKSSPQAKAAALAVQQRGAALFNHAEEFVGNSDLLGAHKSDLWAQGFAEDCAEYLTSMVAHHQFLSQAFSKLPELRGMNSKPGPTAFANMQRMVVVYLGGKLSKDLRQRFASEGLPVYGFDNPVTPKSTSTMKTIMSFVLGAVLIAVMLGITLLNPHPTGFQANVFWAVLAIALAGVASVISGFIELRLGKWLVAGGALAVLATVYFFVPADVLRLNSTTATPSGSPPAVGVAK